MTYSKAPPQEAPSLDRDGFGTRPCLASRRSGQQSCPSLLLCQLRALEQDGAASRTLQRRTEEQVPPYRQPSGGRASFLQVGKALPSPHPIPIVRPLKGSSSTGGSRGLNVRPRSSSCSSPASPRKRGGRESFALPLLPLLPALVGRRAKALLLSFVIAAFPRLAPRGGRGSLLFLSLNRGKRCFPRTPIQSSQAEACSSTGGSRRFTFLEGTHRQFSRLALTGRPGELPLPPSSSLAALVGRIQQAGSCSRSSSLRSLVSPLPGRTRELALPLSQRRRSKLRHLWNSPLPGFPSLRGGGKAASPRSSSASCGLSVGRSPASWAPCSRTVQQAAP